MLITPEVILVQLAIAVIAYFVAREYQIHLGKILICGTCLTIIWPLLTINPIDVDLQFINTTVSSYGNILSNQIVGIVAGVIVSFVGNQIWSRH